LISKTGTGKATTKISLRLEITVNNLVSINTFLTGGSIIYTIKSGILPSNDDLQGHNRVTSTTPCPYFLKMPEIVQVDAAPLMYAAVGRPLPPGQAKLLLRPHHQSIGRARPDQNSTN
jgi:hypothetical protein